MSFTDYDENDLRASLAHKGLDTEFVDWFCAVAGTQGIGMPILSSEPMLEMLVWRSFEAKTKEEASRVVTTRLRLINREEWGVVAVDARLGVNSFVNVSAMMHENYRQAVESAFANIVQMVKAKAAA